MQRVTPFGDDIDPNEDEGPFTRRADKLTPKNFRDLSDGRILAITVDNFCTPEICKMYSQKIINHPQIGGYIVDPTIQRLFLPFYDTSKDARLLDNYFEQAIPAMRAMRELCHPFLSPIDRLRLELDEIWPGGASIAILKGMKMMAGAARVFNNGIGALAHVDNLGFDAAEFPDAPQLVTQFSANLYLQVPPAGGELALWDRRILTAKEEEAYRLPTSRYGLDETELGPPNVVLRPKVGQLIIFDSTRVHAVRPSDGGNRVTMCLFIGLGRDGRLYFWN